MSPQGIAGARDQSNKVHHNRRWSASSAAHKCPSSCQILSHWAKRCTRKALHFYTPVFWRLRGSLWAKVH